VCEEAVEVVALAPHPRVVGEAEILGECHQQPAPRAILQCRDMSGRDRTHLLYRRLVLLTANVGDVGE
jgi:hypothetical protein